MAHTNQQSLYLCTSDSCKHNQSCAMAHNCNGEEKLVIS